MDPDLFYDILGVRLKKYLDYSGLELILWYNGL